MACHCSDCSKSKRISTFRQLQSDEARCIGNSGKYPSKSKKVYMDRYLAARKNLLQSLQWYKRSYERGHRDIFTYPLKRTDWYARKYREARAIVKELRLI